MALIVGSRIHSLRAALNDSGPVHTVQEKIHTSEIAVGQFEEDNDKHSQSRSQTTTFA